MSTNVNERSATWKVRIPTSRLPTHIDLHLVQVALRHLSPGTDEPDRFINRLISLLVAHVGEVEEISSDADELTKLHFLWVLCRELAIDFRITHRTDRFVGAMAFSDLVKDALHGNKVSEADLDDDQLHAAILATFNIARATTQQEQTGSRAL